ncbi:MAG: 2-hydroxyacyl-CoA dehydratase, partial [bacterium]|nr:2-hydroxyacyl-CoA dehydratase [bacterium]
MNNDVEPLFDDEFVGEPPTKRVMAYIQSYREQNAPVAGIYCGYAPIELIQALGIVPALLCAFANKPIAAAEEVLPANLCPLIKSSYGFIITDTCPFYGLSEAVIGETTCDGKKKMFEMISHRKPMFVMDLPQMPNEKEAKDYWAVSIRKLRTFLETTFDRKVLDSAIEEAIKDTNYKNSMMRKVFEYAALEPPVLSWNELYDMTFLALPATGKDMAPILEDIIQKLDSRVANGYFHGEKEAPRVMVTGCPVGGDST